MVLTLDAILSQTFRIILNQFNWFSIVIFHTPKLLVVLLGRANRPCQLRKIILDTYRAFLWRNGSCFAPKLESLTLQTKCVVKTNASEFVVRFSLSRVASNRVSSSRVYTLRKTNNEPENDDFQDRNLLVPRGLHFQLWNVRVFRRKKHVDVSFVWKNGVHREKIRSKPSRPHHLRLPEGFVESFWPSERRSLCG